MSKISKYVLSILAMFALFASVNTNASAATKKSIIKIYSVKSKKYVRKTTKGATYNFNMTGKKTFKFSKATHYLKNYSKNSTWVVSKKANVKKGSKLYQYYYVRNSTNGARGWILNKYLKTKSIIPVLSKSESSARAWIAKRESGGSYTARNGSCYGKYQLQLAYLHGDRSAANQEKVAQKYVTSRYGSWKNAKRFWQSHHWY